MSLNQLHEAEALETPVIVATNIVAGRIILYIAELLSSFALFSAWGRQSLVGTACPNVCVVILQKGSPRPRWRSFGLLRPRCAQGRPGMAFLGRRINNAMATAQEGPFPRAP